jgi:hypothetical protein
MLAERVFGNYSVVIPQGALSHPLSTVVNRSSKAAAGRADSPERHRQQQGTEETAT